MQVLSWDREEDVPECLGQEISRIFLEKSGSREMAFRNGDLYLSYHIELYFNRFSFIPFCLYPVYQFFEAFFRGLLYFVQSALRKC